MGRGRTPDHGNWPEASEYHFMHILRERVARDPDHNPGLRNTDWEQVDYELFAAVGMRYGTERLKGKYYRLRYKFRHFLELLETRGVSWNPETNTVRASDKLWQSLIKQSKEFRTFRKSGCKHYELLKQIFPDIAAGQSRHLSGNSIEHHEAEGEFLYRGLHFGESEVSGGFSMGGSSMRGGNRGELSGGGGCSMGGSSVRGGNRGELSGGGSMGGSSVRGGGRGRKAFTFSCDVAGEHRPAKNLKTERFDDALDAWFTALNAKSMDKSIAEKDDGGYIPPESYSVERVMDILEGMVGIPANAYMRALDKLTSPDWRKIFVKMSPLRRREWLKTLE